MRAVPGPDGRLTSAECILSHFEEQHVNQDVARFAVKCGMWGVVKNMDIGFRKFQKDRAGSVPASGGGQHIARTSSGPGGVDGETGQTVTGGSGRDDGSDRRQVDTAGLVRKIAFGTCVAAMGALAAALDAKGRSAEKGGTREKGARRRRVPSHKSARRRTRRDPDLDRDVVVLDETPADDAVEESAAIDPAAAE
jgi:hypothetical protein